MLAALAKEAEDTGYALRDAQFTRSVLLAISGMFMLIAFDRQLGIGLVLGLLGLAAFLYWHFHEIPRLQKRYNAAQRELLSAIWVNSLRLSNE